MVRLVVLFSAGRDVLRAELLNSRCNHKQVLEKSYKDELLRTQLQQFFAIWVAKEQDPRWRTKLYFYLFVSKKC